MTADIRLCFVGDSFVQGTGDVDGLGWTGRLCRRLRQAGCDVTGYQLGIRRDTSADILARWQAEVERRLPTTVTGRLIFSFGVNDVILEDGERRVPLQASRLHLQTMLREASARYETLMVGPPPIDDAVQNERIAELSQTFGQVCATEGIPYLSAFETLQESTIWLAEVQAGDGAHPNAAGYDALARLIENWPAWRAWWPTMEWPLD